MSKPAKMTAIQKKVVSATEKIIAYVSTMIENVRDLKRFKTTWSDDESRNAVFDLIAKSFVSMPKPPKDKNEPMGPRNSFLLFCNEQKHHHPEMKVAKMREIWSKYTPEEKKIYEDASAQDLIRYNERMREYKTTENYKKHQKILDAWHKVPEHKDIPRDTKRRKDLTKPKPVKSAYNRFLTYELAQHEDLSAEDKKTMRIIIREKWKNFKSTNSLKKRFEAEEDEDKERYEKELQAWDPRASYIEAECAHIKAMWAKKTFKKKITGQRLFQLEQAKNAKIKDPKRKMTPGPGEFLDDWKDLTPEEKEVYNEKADALSNGQSLATIKESDEHEEIEEQKSDDNVVVEIEDQEMIHEAIRASIVSAMSERNFEDDDDDDDNNE